MSSKVYSAVKLPKVYSAAVIGLDALPVEVEVDISQGLSLCKTHGTKHAINLR